MVLRFAAVAEKAEGLGVDLSRGLSTQQVDQSRSAHGSNILPEPESRSLLSIFREALADKTLLILIGAAALALGVEVLRAALEAAYVPHYIDGVAILAAVLIASGVTTLNDWHADRQFRLLSRIRDEVDVPVLRDGRIQSVPVEALVVGDIVAFEAGDKVPADGLLLSGAEVALDESSLTGESFPIDKGREDLNLQAGATVVSGSGQLLVTAVGPNSESGKLQEGLLRANAGLTPLQERLARLADRIGLVGLGAAVLIFMALTISGVVNGLFAVSLDFSTGSYLLQYAIVAVTIVVVAVPEGLPLAVTISLAYSVQRMAKDKNFVRTLASCETMGAATVVCSDKTGTLTANRMEVVGGWVAGRRLATAPVLSDWTVQAAARMCQVAAVNSTAHRDRADDGQYRTVGNPTEGALLGWMESAGQDWSWRRATAHVLRRLAFSSDRKRMSTLVQDGDQRVLLVKGAPEAILECADWVEGEEGTHRFEEAVKASALEAVAAISEDSHRCLALAYRTLEPHEDQEAPPQALEQRLVLLGVMAMTDPVRSDVEPALEACERAGVEVKVVTGDSRAIATSIAQKVGLLSSNDLVMEGSEFRSLSDDVLAERLPRLRVLARSVPSDKLRLVEALQATGAVVAVTGDGTNDGPALRQADVGFAMGLSGTEVAKEASDIILLDDKFSSIVAGIEWGRAIFANVRKFLQFQLTVNVVALSTAFLAAVLGFGLPLNTVQLLWVNLIMDTLAALALATEGPTPALLKQPPHGRHEPLITSAMQVSIGVMGAYMLACLLGSLLWDGWVPAGTTPVQRLTFVFNAFVFMQLFNEVNARSTRFDQGVLSGLNRSPLFLGVWIMTAGLQVLIVEFGGGFFRTASLSPDLWLWSVLLGMTVLPVGMLVRMVGRALTPAPGSR